MKQKISAFMLTASMLMTIVPGTVQAASSEANPDMSNWFEYEFPTADDIAGTVLDASNLQDAPAGNHGYLTESRGDNLYFEDGTEARFWGIDVTENHCYPSHDVAVESSRRIAQSGFNLVRFHLIDSGDIWGPKATGDRVLREDVMDRMCFFINELKKQGIYVFIDMMISKPITSDLNEAFDIENLPGGLKIYSYVNSDLKEETKKYMQSILGYYNKYTGMCLKDDPVIALIDLKNEDSVGCSGTFASGKYHNEVKAQWNEWLCQKYGTTEALKAAWGNDKDQEYPNPILDDDESLENGTVKIFEDATVQGTTYNGADVLWARRNARTVDEFKFRDLLLENYFNDCIGFLREMGVKCRITGSTSWSSNGYDRVTYYANRNTDFTDLHYYLAMPSSTSYEDGVTRTDDIRSVLDYDKESISKNQSGEATGRGAYGMVNQITARRVHDNPITISEWNDVAPNKYRAETLLMMSSYMALNGMNPLVFAWKNVNTTPGAQKKETFGTSETPEYLGAFPAAARMFLRNDVQETESEFCSATMQGNEPFTVPNQYISDYGMYGLYMGLVGKTGMAFEDMYDPAAYDNTVLQLTKDAYDGDMNFVSITGQLSMDYANKMFRVNTPKSQCISGFTSGYGEVELDDVKFNINNYYATAYLNSVDDNPLYNSKKMLLTLVGDTRNTGQVMSDDEKTMTTAGSGPILCEPITGTVTIKTDKPIQVRKVSTKGKVSTSLVVPTKTSDGYSFNLDGDTMYYQITRDASVTPSANTHISLGNSSSHNVFSDVDASNAKKSVIERAALAGFIGAASGNNFSPSSNVTRKDFLNAILKATRVSNRVWTGSSSNYSYGDIAYNEEGFEGMADAVYIGLITPKKWGVFIKRNYVEPNAEVTREEAMVWIAKALGDGSYPSNRTRVPESSFSLSQYSDYSSSDSNNEYYRKTLGLGYMSAKNGKIAKSDKVTRQEAAEIAYNIMWK